MAKISFDLGSVQDALARLGNIDEPAPRMLKSAGPIIAATLKEKLGPHRRTGGLIRSVRPGKPKKGKNGGWYLTVGFYGKDTDGRSNAVKAAGLEYGNSHQQPEPFLDAAVRSCEEIVVDAMQAQFSLWQTEKELKG